MPTREFEKNSDNRTGLKIGGAVGVIILLLGMAILFGFNQMDLINREINEIEFISQNYPNKLQQEFLEPLSGNQNEIQNTLMEEISDAIRDSTTQIETNETNYLAGQLVIIGLVGVMAAVLGHFLGQINRDLKIQVKKKTKELQQANEKLKLLDKRKDEFIGIASHELKSPIQPIFGFAELAKTGNIDQKEAWEGVTQLAKQLQDLANDVLDVNRIESKRFVLDKEALSVNDLILNTTTSMKLSLNKHVTIYEELDDDFIIQVDRLRMEQVLRNLLGNAIKFTKHGTIKIFSKIDKVNQFVQIKITDSGKGIPQEILPNVFDKFVTKGQDIHNKGGTGLGLFLCKGIIEAHGGKISAYNNKIGATFEFTIPISIGSFQKSVRISPVMEKTEKN